MRNVKAYRPPGTITSGSRAISLLETVIALFVLLSVLTFTLELYSRSLGNLNKVERNARAASFSDNVLSELRHWAKNPANFRESTWADFESHTDPDFPGFEAKVRTRFSSAMSPCTDQESARPVDRQVLMTATLKVATVDISFDGEHLFAVTALLNEPKREVAATKPVVVTPIGSPPSSLPPDATHRYEAKLMDISGIEIEDVKFSWSVQPLGGNASIGEQARDGSWGGLTNAYIIPPSDRIYTGGQCQVVASVTYFGHQYRGISDPIALAKP